MNTIIYYIIDGYGKVEAYYFGGFASKFLCYINYKLLCKNKRKFKLYNGFYLRSRKIIDLLEELKYNGFYLSSRKIIDLLEELK